MFQNSNSSYRSDSGTNQQLFVSAGSTKPILDATKPQTSPHLYSNGALLTTAISSRQQPQHNYELANVTNSTCSNSIYNNNNDADDDSDVSKHNLGKYSHSSKLLVGHGGVSISGNSGCKGDSSGQLDLCDSETNFMTDISNFNNNLIRNLANSTRNNNTINLSEEGDEVDGLSLNLSSAMMGMDEDDKKYNQLQDLENNLLLHTMHTNFLKKMDFARNPDYRSLNRGSGADFTVNKHNSSSHISSSTIPLSSSSSQLGGNGAGHFQKVNSSCTNNNNIGNSFLLANSSPISNISNSSGRNTMRNHIITDTLPGPESCV